MPSIPTSQSPSYITTGHHNHIAVITGSIVGILAFLLLASGLWHLRKRRGRTMAPSAWFRTTGILPKSGLVPIQSPFVRGGSDEQADPPPAYERVLEEGAQASAEEEHNGDKVESESRL